MSSKIWFAASCIFSKKILTYATVKLYKFSHAWVVTLYLTFSYASQVFIYPELNYAHAYVYMFYIFFFSNSLHLQDGVAHGAGHSRAGSRQVERVRLFITWGDEFSNRHLNTRYHVRR